jgi:hypothetical protein
MTSKYEQFVSREMREFVTLCVEHSREMLEADGRLTPVAFVGTIGGECSLVTGLAAMPKKVAAKVITATARKLDADFVLHIDEGWLKQFEGTADDFERLRAENNGEVRTMPGRIDVVLFNLDTRVGFFFAGPERTIIGERDGEPVYSFGDAEFNLMENGSGTFVGLLPKRAAQ